MALAVMLKIYVLDHAAGRESECLAWGERTGTDTWTFAKLTCTECDGEGSTKGEQTYDEIHGRVARHAQECRDRYAPRAYRCREADRKGDRFDCHAALHH